MLDELRVWATLEADANSSVAGSASWRVRCCSRLDPNADGSLAGDGLVLAIRVTTLTSDILR